MVNPNRKNQRHLASGISVSNDTRETGLNNHDLIIGGTGCGKTGGYIFRLLYEPNDSMIVSDTKGQLHKMFRGYLQQCGYKVRVLDFVRPDKSIGYNPLSFIRRSPDGNYNSSDIKKLSQSIVPDLDSSEPFWQKAATRYISMLISYVLETCSEDEKNMCTVADFHRECVCGNGMMLLASHAKINPKSLASKKYKEMKGSSSADKMWSSIMEFVNEALEPFSYSEYEQIFAAKDEVDIENLIRENTVLFVNSSDNDSSFMILSQIFYKQMLQTMINIADNLPGGRLPVPVRLILDDFAAGPKIEDFDNLISVIRSREISLSIIIQSISQLREKYSDGAAKTIINNCDHILFLSGHDNDTAYFFADYLNYSPFKVLTKKREECYLFTDGEKPIPVKKLKPYPVDVMALYPYEEDDESKPKEDEQFSDEVTLNDRIQIAELFEQASRGELRFVDTRTDEQIFRQLLSDYNQDF